MHIAFWIRIAFLCGLVLFFVVLPLLMFFTALLEKRSTFRLRPLAPEKLKPWGARLQKVIALAVPPAFEPLGLFSEDGRGQLAMFISEDFSTILAVGQYLISNYWFLTPLEDDRMLVTAHTGSGTDLSGLELREMLPAESPDVVYRHHLDRIAALEEVPGIFNPEGFIDQLREHEVRRMHKSIERGMARAVSEDRYVCTCKGAFLTAFSIHRTGGEVRKAAEAAKKKDKAYKAWAKSREHQNT